MLDSFAHDGIHMEYVFRDRLQQRDGTGDDREAGANYLSVAPGANYLLDPPRIDPGGAPLSTGVGLPVPVRDPADHACLRPGKGARRGSPAILNFAPARSFPMESFHMVDILVVNEGEAEFLSGRLGVRGGKPGTGGGCPFGARSPDRHHHDGVRGSCLSPAGSFEGVCRRFRLRWWIPRPPETHSAARLRSRLASGLTWRQPCGSRPRRAALSVTRLGAQPSIPTRAEIDEFLVACSAPQGGSP